MKRIDRILQSWRIREASKYIKKGSKVLDIGSFDGSLFKQLKSKSIHGIGIEPLLSETLVTENYKILPGYFPEIEPEDKDFDIITVLAVFEHIPPDKQFGFLRSCYFCLNSKGSLIITVPSKMVDTIMDIMIFFKLINGMSTHEHFGFKPGDTRFIARKAEFELKTHRLFQFGLNNLFVFEKSQAKG